MDSRAVTLLVVTLMISAVFLSGCAAPEQETRMAVLEAADVEDCNYAVLGRVEGVSGMDSETSVQKMNGAHQRLSSTWDRGGSVKAAKDKMRAAAAELGADAVVVTFKSNQGRSDVIGQGNSRSIRRRAPSVYRYFGNAVIWNEPCSAAQSALAQGS